MTSIEFATCHALAVTKESGIDRRKYELNVLRRSLICFYPIVPWVGARSARFLPPEKATSKESGNH